MVIEINAELFYDLDKFKDLRFLLNLCFYKRRYNLFVEITEILSSDLYNKLDNDEKLIIEELYIRFVQEGYTSILKVGDDFTLEESIRFLDQPFVIILENSNNDGHFIDGLLKHFRKEGKHIRRFKENGWLKYGMGGGCTNTPNFIENELRSFDGLPKDKYQYLRCFVLVDSDKEYLGHNNSNKITLEEYLNAHSIPYHIFEKREMENYLPIDAFYDIPNNDEYIEAYNRLSPIQQDYFNIEKGFNHEKFENLKPEAQELYSNLSNFSKQLFRKSGLNMNGNFKSEFPKLYCSEWVSRENLQAKCSHQNDPNELPHLLEKISNLL